MNREEAANYADDAEKNEEFRTKKEPMENNFPGKYMFFYDEDKFLAKEEDFHQKS